MNFLLGIVYRKKIKIIASNNIIELMVIMTALSKIMIDKIVKEKNIAPDKARELIIKCVLEGELELD